MTLGDSFISYLNSMQSGSWATFKAAASALPLETNRHYLLARSLAARGLLEVHWDDDRAWCAPPIAIIRLPRTRQEPWSFLSVGLLEDDYIELLREHGLGLEPRINKLIDDLTYTSYNIEGPVDSVLDTLPEDPRVYFDFCERAESTAERIIEAIPTVFQAAQYGPVVDPSEIANAETIESYDPEQRTFVGISEVDLGYDHECLMAQWRFDQKRYYRVSNGVCRRIDRAVGICNALRLDGSRFVEVDGDALFVERRIALPLLMERTMFFAGAEQGFDGKWRRYNPLPNAIARQISYRLGISPKVEVTR